jgi:hypothetical protein
MSTTLIASLADGEAVLRFPFDERLRVLLRAIPGRRWDAAERVWRVPLDPDRAEAVTRLLASAPHAVQISDALDRALERRARRARDECLIDVARADDSWWFSFATDRAKEHVAALLEHPDAYTLPAIGRGLIPVDRHAAELLRAAGPGLRLTDDAGHALIEITQSPSTPAPETRTAVAAVELRRGRGGQGWVVVAPEHAPLARALATRVGLAAFDGPTGAVAFEALEGDAARIRALLVELDTDDVAPSLTAWLERATTWRGTVEVERSSEQPMFVLIGPAERLPTALRERAHESPDGVRVPLTLESWRLIDGQLRAWVSHAARRCVAALEAGRPAPPAVLELSAVHDEPWFVLAPGHDVGLLERFGALAGAVAGKPNASGAQEHASLPSIRVDPFCVPALDEFISERDVWVADDALAALQEIREQHAQAAGLVALSAAHDGDVAVDGLGGELKPFQRAGVAYLLAQRRAFLADEQGLGKTIEAMATLQADGAYPAIVVCPASLKLNWQRELERWLPGRETQVLSGVAGAVAPADVTVVNYDIVAARIDALSALAPRAVVVDESHYCKNPRAQRTQAVARLCSAVAPDGLVLALTGTPVMNRPQELISQLRIIGRLGDFGSGAQFGQRFRGPDAHHRLHWHLRARCFARRLKSEVLPQLPAKTRAVVPVELDNEPEYRLAEQDIIAWLRSQPLDLRTLDAKVAAALRAERLVRLNMLKLLAARGKLAAALAWIHDFLSSGERLVVFATHREIQRAVLERFPAALHILGEDRPIAREQALQDFQAPDGALKNQLIVCSLEVAGQGITLTRASNVAFLELAWTPAKHDQAGDRCHRIGQASAVNATYLLAADTIDEAIASLLERKRAVIGAVTDGREEDEGGVLDALVAELRGEPYRHLRAVA